MTIILSKRSSPPRQAVQWGLMLRRKTTDADVLAVEASARRRGVWFSGRSFRSNPSQKSMNQSANPSASARSSNHNHSASGRHSVTSGLRAPSTGSDQSASSSTFVRPPQDAWAAAAAPTNTSYSGQHSGVDSSRGGFSNYSAPVQRPVETGPQRATRR